MFPKESEYGSNVLKTKTLSLARVEIALGHRVLRGSEEHRRVCVARKVS